MATPIKWERTRRGGKWFCDDNCVHAHVFLNRFTHRWNWSVGGGSKVGADSVAEISGWARSKDRACEMAIRALDLIGAELVQL